MLEAIQNESATVSRRAVLCGAVGVALGISAGISTDLAQATNAAGVTQAGSKLKLALAKNPTLAKVGGAVLIPQSDGSTVAIVRIAKGVNGFTAINLSCTHQGVTVEQSGNAWMCPAHGSEFSLAGKVVRGPARQALVKYPVSATSKVITIG